MTSDGYDVFINGKMVGQNVNSAEAWALVGASWSPYTVYYSGTKNIAEEFIPF